LLPVFFFLVSACWFTASANAQSPTATLSGTVEDQKGALIGDASLALINVDQVTQRLTTTNAEGSFVFTLVPPGRYSLTATREGFTPVEIKDVVLNVNDRVAITIQLNVGQVSQMVQIVDGASLIGQSPAIGTTVDRGFLQSLPLNGRSFQSLISLTPGVTIARTTNINTGQFSVNGQRTNTNYFTVDGVSANIGVSTQELMGQESAGSVPGLTSFGGTNNLISVDALQEFNIQTSTFAPEFGRAPGAQVSLVSRAGTREFHGSLFEYFRNDILDANDFFANRGGLPKAQLRLNQFGGVLGGPIMLPRFGEGGPAWFDGSKHSFFFFSYEGLRLRQPQTVSAVNLVALRVRSQAPSSIGFLLNALPIPTGPEVGTTGRATFTGTYSDQSTLNATSFRIDHNFNDRVSLFGRFNYAPSESRTRNKPMPSLVNTINLKTLTFTVGATQNFNTNTFNEFRFNYSRSSGTSVGALDNYGGAVPVTVSQLVPPAVVNLQSGGTIQFYAGTYSIGDLTDNLQRQLNIVDGLSRIWGSHNFKLGVDYRRMTPIFSARDYLLSCTFNNVNAVVTGRAAICQVVARKPTKPVFNNFSTYFQDTWQASSRLMLTYGTRWDVNPPPSEADDQHAFVVATNNPLTTKLAPLGTPLWKTTYDNFAPRVGASYRLIEKTAAQLVVRGGVGLFYDLGNTQGGDAYASGAFRTTPANFPNVLYPLTAAQAAVPPFPTTAANSRSYGFDPNLKLPYTWQWNLTFQQSLGANQTISTSYVAALSRRLLRPRIFQNSVNPNFMVLQYVDNGARADYHSLQTQFVRRLSRNFQALASYTWSHAIDEISDETGNLSSIRGNADFDIRHNFSAAFSYLSPWKQKGWQGRLLRDWQGNLILHAQSAYPLTPFTNQFAVLSGNLVAQYPNLVAGVPLYLSDPSVPGGRKINRAAFVAPATGTQGNVGRNSLRGFPTYQADVALQRTFSLREPLKLTMRGEVFNVFNHANFDIPVADLNNTAFGQSNQMLGRGLSGLSPIYQIGGPRSIQLALRLSF
jgi:outer membrane receptor protein involved in Fe transport